MIRRLKKELADIHANLSPDYSLEHVHDSDPTLWRAIITGPKGSPYEGGVFPLSIRIPLEYPFRPPRIRYMVRVYHPYIVCDGTVQNYMFYHWRPSYTLDKLLQALRRDLLDIHPELPLADEVAHIYRTNRRLFWDTACEWTQLFASPMSECTNCPL